MDEKKKPAHKLKNCRREMVCDKDVILRIKEKVLEALETMTREGKETIKIQVVKSTDPYESALADEIWSRALKRYQERQEKRTEGNRRTE